LLGVRSERHRERCPGAPRSARRSRAVRPGRGHSFFGASFGCSSWASPPTAVRRLIFSCW
jgi:hypothetical protein